jgi:hypothetical protein
MFRLALFAASLSNDAAVNNVHEMLLLTLLAPGVESAAMLLSENQIT